jgi:hypothetical protein
MIGLQPKATWNQWANHLFAHVGNDGLAVAGAVEKLFPAPST